MIEVILEDERWEAVGLEALCGPSEREALAVTGRATKGFEIALMGCNDARIAVLNKDFRGKEAATNVLSWPASEAPSMEACALGDIAIAFDTCHREAAEKGISVQDHVTHLVIHGILHLLGYDHILDADAEKMEALEIKALAKLGVSNPY